MIRVLGFVITVVSLGAVLHGAAPLWETQRKLLNYRPVTVTVVARLVPGSHDYPDRRKRSQLIGQVEYHYEVEGQPYLVRAEQGYQTDQEAWRVTVPVRNVRLRQLQEEGKGKPDQALDKLRHIEEANQLEGREQRQGYCHPANPHELFLPAEPRLSKLTQALGAVPVMVFGLIGLLLGSPLWHPQRLGSKAGWDEIRPSHSLRKRLVTALVVAIVWHVAGAVLWAMYFAQISAASPGVIAGACGYFALGLVPLWCAGRYVFLTVLLKDARVFVTPGIVRWGVPFSIRLVLTARRAATLREVRVGVICTRTRGRREFDCFAQWVQISETVRLPAGEKLETILPDVQLLDQEPSTSPGQWGRPQFAWRISVKAALQGAPTYRADFPIYVASSP